MLRATIIAFILSVGLIGVVQAEPLPEQDALRNSIGTPPTDIAVVEPHLSTPGRPVQVTYRGWPATVVLDKQLGNAWRQEGIEVEFRALDGYVSRIPGERFVQHEAHLVFERVGHSTFTIDNLAQNETNVPLGPYYLVWDNVGKPDLIAEGGTYWPYQVVEVLVSSARKDALTPPGLSATVQGHVATVQKYCLSCHQVNGYGGAKWPGNLAEQARRYDRATFTRWVIEPGQVKPNTTMPGLPSAIPLAQREQLADVIFDFLTEVPVLAATKD